MNKQIAPEDGMFRDMPGGLRHYFAVGESALHCIRVSMLAAGIKTVGSILDLPCGHGRVLRHLHSNFPEARLTACDIDREGANFCAVTFGATPVYGHRSPQQIRLRSTYDLIWVGSLLTHLSSDDCEAFLELFRTKLNRPGLLIFSVHGRTVANRIRRGDSNYGLDATKISQVLKDYATEGFGFASYPEQTLPGINESYGISLVSPGWVFKQVARLPKMRLLNYTESGWDNHHDVVALLLTQ